LPWPGLNFEQAEKIIAGLPPEQAESVLRSGFRLRPLFGLEKDRNEQSQSHLADHIFCVSGLAGRALPDRFGLLDEPVHRPATGYLAQQRMDRLALSLAGRSQSSFRVWDYKFGPPKGKQSNQCDLEKV
jgi:hypothetical protein